MKKQFIDLDDSLHISDKTTFEMFKNSSFYKDQNDNRFFWIEPPCIIDDISEKFKVGLCFRNNSITRMELYCIGKNTDNEIERSRRNTSIIEELDRDYDLGYKKIENSFDKRNNYSSIIISF